MKIQMLGAAQTVTGSCYLIEANGKKFTIDCGLHQGNAEIEKRNRETAQYQAASLDFIILTHAHIDHSGLLPRLVKDGFKGPIYCTKPTKDLAQIMLLDSAHIQETEAAWSSRRASRRGEKPVEPLYTQEDAQKTIDLFKVAEYRKTFSPAPGIRVLFRDAGHILGSGFVGLEINNGDEVTRLTFSGDLGRPETLLLEDPDHPSFAPDYLFLESTYGDRDHKDESSTREELVEAIRYSYDQGQKTIIPAFAVERTQEILHCLFLLNKEGKLPKDLPIFVDSPLAIRATEIFRKSAHFMDDDYQSHVKNGDDPLMPPNTRFTLETRESVALNSLDGPAVIISASGMCNAGRIKHHLYHNLWRPGASIVFVGYQAIGTPGRKIVDGAKSINLFGEEVQVAAKVFTIGGFSAHAGQSELLDWVSSFQTSEMKVFLTHGEEHALSALSSLLEERFGLSVHIPGYLEKLTLEPGKPLAVAPSDNAPGKVNWDILFSDAHSRVDFLQKHADVFKSMRWEDQVELRDRMLDLNNRLMKLLSLQQ